MGPVEPKVVLDAHRLLDQAVAIADDADVVAGSAERMRLYYLAALRTTGAALAVLESRRRGPRGVRNAWRRLDAQVGADDRLAVLSAFFAGYSGLRSRIETGLVADVPQDVVARVRVRLAELIEATESVLAAYEQGREPLVTTVSRRSA